MFRHFSLTAALLAVAGLCFAPSARASDTMFTVAHVHVDANGYSASVAQTVAFAQGRPKAWDIMFRRMARQQDWSKEPKLSDIDLQRLVRNFTVSNERRSTTRYTADITYYFNPAAVARVLRASNIAYAQSTARRFLLLPMSPAFARGSQWTNAFVAPRFADALVPFTLPIGDALDASALVRLDFNNTTWLDIADVAERVHATEAVLALVTIETAQRKLQIAIKRIGIGEAPMQTTIEVPYYQTPYSAFPTAADATMSAIAEMWKQRSAVDYSQKGTITLDARAGSLEQWSSLQAQLATVPNITSVRVDAMDIGEARITVGYLGTLDQLREGLAQANLQIANSSPDNSGEWILRPGAPSPTAGLPAPGAKPKPTPVLRP
jgi:hypothetical protein